MRKILVTLLSIVSLATLVACGGGSSSNSVSVPPAPSGGNNAGFSNASLTGNYVFAANGLNNSNNYAVVGQFTADGKGNITAGTRDTVNDGGGQTLGESINGNYSVNSDGRGLAVLNGGSGQVIYNFVLQSPSAGKLFQDGTTSNSVIADAVGRIELQSGTPGATGTYIVRLDGEDVNKSPYGAVSGLNFSGGAITGTGAYDENDAGLFSAQLSATGTYNLTGTRGSATLATPNGPNTGTHNFIAYYVSPSRLELLSTDKSFWLHGYADLQTSLAAASTAAFAGPEVFNLSGLDGGSGTGAYPIVETGRFTFDGAGNITSTSAVKDYNERSAFYSPTFSGTYSAAANGRWTAIMNGFSVGPIANENLVGWQVSPTQSLVLVSFASNPNISGYATVETGEMRSQTLGLSNASVTGNYAQSLSGLDTSLGNFESTGNYLAGGGNLTGTIDFQTDNEGLAQDSSQSGSYTVDPVLGRGTATVSGVPVMFYTVDGSTIYLISSNAASGYQGTLLAQQP